MGELKQGSLLVFLAVSAALAPAGRANPTGPHVVNGQVVFDASQAGVLDIANSPNAIIEWQGFSIPAGEITRFIQQSADSAVLNRVVGQDPSAILGQLLSNGQVFLINPNGIVFGQGSMVDTAGFLASTLNIGNDDFLRGNYLFVNPGPGKIENYGVIHVTNGGSVVLISPNIENSGLIQSDGGHLVLAAGEKLTLTSMDAPQVRFEIQAPEDKVLNIGQLMANGGGSIDVFAGAIRSSGAISADSVEVDKSGRIHLVAQGDVTLEAASQTHANGPAGGSVLVQSQGGTTLVSGTVEAKGSDGVGGTVELLGRNVGLIDQAAVNASGKTGGGTVHIGGDQEGGGTTQRAEFVYIGQDAQVHADALDTGNGGTVIAYADDTARIYGHLSARGGAVSGNGGFVETSGKKGFELLNAPDTGASHGLGGMWLIDPDDLTVSTTDANISPSVCCASLFQTAAAGASINVSTIASSLSSYGGGVTLQAGGNITWAALLNLSHSGTNTLTLKAGNDIKFNSGGILSNGSNSLNLKLWANYQGSTSGQVYFNGGELNVGSGTIDIQSGTNAASGTLNFGNTSSVTITAGGGINADTLNITNGSLSATGTSTLPQKFSNFVTLNGPVSVNTLNLSGQLNSNNSIEVKNSFNWTQGVIGGSGSTLKTLGTTTINKNLVELTDSRTWTNTGTINWGGNNLTTLKLWDSASLNNQGTLNISAYNGVLGGNSSQGLVNSSGGTINVSNAVTFDGVFSNKGTLNLNSGPFTTGYSSTFTNDGTVNLGNYSANLKGVFNNNGTFNINGGWAGISGSFSNAGAVNLNGGGMWVTSGGTDRGTYSLRNNAWIDFYGASGAITRAFNGAISNTDKTGEIWFGNGTFNINNGIDVGWLGIESDASVNIGGNYNSNWETYIAGSLNVGGAYTQLSYGDTVLDYGTLTASSVTVSGGLLPITMSQMLANGSNGGAGTFEGTGTVNLNGGTFTNAGGLYLWGGPLTLNGNYVQTPTGQLGIAISSPAAYGFLDRSDYSGRLYNSITPGSLNVRGSATMAGSLFILWDGFGNNPHRAIETTGGLYGSFSTVEHYPATLGIDYSYDGRGLTVSLGSASSFVSSNPALQDTVFDASVNQIIATLSSSDMTNSGGSDGNGAPKSCKK